uniref:SJCHGC05456 protein n=1 Tax=Schistosoma japonicum TaxID=6182 RepID=Q5DGW6_SCHJA|nr:SJCHGC05456 protein [Schistosoma japonicum]
MFRYDRYFSTRIYFLYLMCYWLFPMLCLSGWTGIINQSRKSSGLAYISRFLIQRPNESIRWIFLLSWLLSKNPIGKTTNLSTIELKTSHSMETTLTIYANLIIKCLLVINELRNECPMNTIFAAALVNFGTWWLTVNTQYTISIQRTDLYNNLLLGLRRAAIFFPDTPNILSTLRSVTENMQTGYCRV